MLQDIWLARHPEEFARRFPAWYWLYFEIAEFRVTREKTCSVLGVESTLLAQCERSPAAIHTKSGAYNLLDLIAIDSISKARQAMLPYEYLIRHVINWGNLAWQALVGAVRGRDVWIAVVPEKNGHYGPYFLSDDLNHPTDATPINLGSSVRRVLLENNWPRISVAEGTDGQWVFSFGGCGRLLLEPLPKEDEGLCWPEIVEDAEMAAYRQLSSKNIHDVDPIYHLTPMWSEDPAVLKARIDEAIDELLAVNLDSRVPSDVRQMFEVMKGSLAYGFFYRPLTTFAASQVYSIEDAALHHRCVQAGIKPPKTFQKRIDALLRAGIIPPYEAHVWNAKRELRNSVAHRTHQWLMWPGMDFGTIQLAALDINRLFTPIFGDEPSAAGPPAHD